MRTLRAARMSSPLTSYPRCTSSNVLPPDGARHLTVTCLSLRSHVSLRAFRTFGVTRCNHAMRWRMADD
jgi:hypothetical protein